MTAVTEVAVTASQNASWQKEKQARERSKYWGIKLKVCLRKNKYSSDSSGNYVRSFVSTVEYFEVCFWAFFATYELLWPISCRMRQPQNAFSNTCLPSSCRVRLGRGPRERLKPGSSLFLCHSWTSLNIMLISCPWKSFSSCYTTKGERGNVCSGS